MEKYAHLGRRLAWHGFLLFLLGLATGSAIPALYNKHMGLAAHLEGVLNGLFLIGVGLLWAQFTLSDRMKQALYWLALYGTYVNWLATLLSAIFGTSKLTPLGGAGFSAEPWQEAIVGFGLISLSLVMFAVCGIGLWGLRGKTAPAA